MLNLFVLVGLHIQEFKTANKDKENLLTRLLAKVLWNAIARSLMNLPSRIALNGSALILMRVSPIARTKSSSMLLRQSE